MIFSVGTWFSLNSFTYVPIVGHCNIQSTLKCFFILNGKVSSVGSMCTTEGVRVLPLFLADRTAAAILSSLCSSACNVVHCGSQSRCTLYCGNRTVTKCSYYSVYTLLL